MSGHSKWSNIKFKKGLMDKKRGRTFSKMARLVTIAAKQGDPNPDSNPKLRMAIDKARSLNMPKDNIERAIKRGLGQDSSEQMAEATYEALGPHGLNMIIETITDNKNRTLSELKNVLAKNKGKLASSGAVSWNFSRAASLSVDKENWSPEKELLAIDAGAQDITEKPTAIEITTGPSQGEALKNTLEQAGCTVIDYQLNWLAKTKLNLPATEKKAAEKLITAISDHDDIQEVYSNLNG